MVKQTGSGAAAPNGGKPNGGGPHESRPPQGNGVFGSSPARLRALAVFLVVLLVGIIFASFMVGSYSMTPAEVFQTVHAFVTGNVGESNRRAVTVLFSIRLPRVLLASMVGAMLSVSGAAYQGIFRNPMVSPDILGVSNAASVGVAIGLLWGWPTLSIHLLSFCFGIGAVLLVLFVAHAVGGRSGNTTVVMILTGVVVGSIGSALLSLIKYVADPDNVLPAITYWLMGSFARSGNVTNIVIVFAIMAVGVGTLLVLRWKLNAMTFGEDEARTLGVNVKRTRIVVILAATLMTSATVCLCGVIGWVGLIIPHIVRLMCGPNYKTLLPISLLTGACFMLVVDDAARLLVASELPVGVLTALIGAPLFIYMLFKSKGQYL